MREPIWSFVPARLTETFIDRTFHTLTVRLARLVVNAYLENVDLVARTLEAFGDDAAESR